MAILKNKITFRKMYNVDIDHIKLYIFGKLKTCMVNR